MKLGHEYNQSGEAMTKVPVLSHVPVVPPESALLPMAPAVTPPEADSHQWQHAVLQS